jgi:hypothetical protein
MPTAPGASRLGKHRSKPPAARRFPGAGVASARKAAREPGGHGQHKWGKVFPLPA